MQRPRGINHVFTRGINRVFTRDLEITRAFLFPHLVILHFFTSVIFLIFFSNLAISSRA